MLGAVAVAKIAFTLSGVQAGTCNMHVSGTTWYCILYWTRGTRYSVTFYSPVQLLLIAAAYYVRCST